MDNATAEYAFVKTFFSVEVALPQSESSNLVLSPSALLSPDRGSFAEQRSNPGSEYGEQHNAISSIANAPSLLAAAVSIKEEQATTDALWKQIMDPVLEYCQVCPHLHLPGVATHASTDLRAADPRPDASSCSTSHYDSSHGGRCG